MKGPMGWIRGLDFPWLLWGAWSTRPKTRNQETGEEVVVVTYSRVDVSGLGCRGAEEKIGNCFGARPKKNG